MKRTNYPYKNFSLSDIKGEKWDDIPGLDGAYQLSSYGRIKSLRRWVERPRGGRWTKDRILSTKYEKGVTKSGCKKEGTLHKTIHSGGNHFGIQVMRLVYYLFVEKFDLDNRKLVVRSRDGNNLHVCPENVLLTNRSALITRAYKRERRPLSSFGNTNITLSQYDLNGNLLGSFASISSAAERTDVGTGTISQALRNKDGYGSGFIWKYGSADKLKIRLPDSIKAWNKETAYYDQPVSQYDMSGKKIKEYNSMTQAAQLTGLHLYEIRQVIEGESRFFVKKYHWKKGSGPSRIDTGMLLRKIKENRANPILVAVTQYSLDGKRIKKYRSLTEAAKALSVTSGSIGDAALRSRENEKYAISHGFIWLRGKGPAGIKISAFVKRRKYLTEFKKQPVSQYDERGVLVKTYSSINEACYKTGFNQYNIMAVLSGTLKTHKGYYWRSGKTMARIPQRVIASIAEQRYKNVCKRVTQYDRQGKKIKTFSSLGEAERMTGVSASYIGLTAAGKYQFAKGFRWRFEL
jgi:hypothetical protein